MRHDEAGLTRHDEASLMHLDDAILRRHDFASLTAFFHPDHPSPAAVRPQPDAVSVFSLLPDTALREQTQGEAPHHPPPRGGT